MTAFAIDRFPEGQRVMFNGQGDRGTVLGDADPVDAALGRVIKVKWDDGLTAHHKPTEVRRLRAGIQQAIDLWANGDAVPAYVLADHLQGLLSEVQVDAPKPSTSEAGDRG